jgi:cysteinyl-tRNA synthetase
LGPVALSLLARVRHLFAEAGGVLGLFNSRPALWLEGIKASKAGQIDISPDEIEHLIIERSQARKAKNFKRGDEIRDMLLAKGIQLLDSAQGTTWNVK